jgi:hypothetical protein
MSRRSMTIRLKNVRTIVLRLLHFSVVGILILLSYLIERNSVKKRANLGKGDELKAIRTPSVRTFIDWRSNRGVH